MAGKRPLEGGQTPRAKRHQIELAGNDLRWSIPRSTAKVVEYRDKTSVQQLSPTKGNKGKRKITESEKEGVEEAQTARKVPRTSHTRSTQQGRNESRQHHSNYQQMPFADPIQLHKLAQKKPPHQLAILSQHTQEFSDCLASLQDYSDREHYSKVSFIVKLLAKVLTYQENGTIANKIDRVVLPELTSDSSRALLHALGDTLCQMPMQTVQAKRVLFISFLVDVNLLFKHLLEKMPAYFSQYLPVDAFYGSTGQLASQEIRYREIHETSKQLLQQRDDIRATYYETKVDTHETTGEDYTALPTPEELRQKMLPLDLQPNSTKGYVNTADYLTRHYRLLREDFIHPLRCVMQKLQVEAHEEEVDSHEVRVYKNVRFNEGTTYLPGEGTAFRVSFELPGRREVKWDRSKCLTYGSLLCLSSDHFKTVLFASVAERKTEDLRQGIVVIKLENNVDGLSLRPDRVFEMADSPGYYAAYAPVLKRLKELSSNPSLLPLSQYLVQCLTDVQQPAYLRGKQLAAVNLAGIVCECNGNQFMGDCPHGMIDVSNCLAWSELQTPLLDASQKAALHAALTKELAIIQGPPGTGKTYIGLKIAEALLKNSHHLKQNGPIVVVCYTNHALDQFLEGLLAIQARLNSIIIRRVGGRCKSDKVKQLNVRTYIGNACRQLHIYGCSPPEVHKLRQRIQAITELLAGEFIPYNFTLYCSLLEQRTIDDLEYFCELDFLNGLRSREEYGYLAAWLSYELGEKIRDWLHGGEVEEEEKYVNYPYKAIEDDRRVTIAEEKEEDSFLPKALGQEAVKSFVTTFKAVEPLTYKRVQTVLENQTLDQVEPLVRLQLFKFFLIVLRNKLQLSLKKKEAKQEMYQREKDLITLRCLKEANVIGLTTTGAAKHNRILSQIEAKTVIIEEAAEVLEAHVITTLTRHTQHLILIGDHKQLRPKTNDHVLARDYRLDFSLFERLVDNKLPCVTLEVQHRMRPEISEIVSSSVYDGMLQNDECTENYDDVTGMKHNVFFVDHEEPESSDEDLKSPTNSHEARFMAMLCNYLLQQGYKPEDITVITPYTGQMFTLRGEFANVGVKDVRITPIDSYQGEENEIVLLSLVRSNNSNIPGFVKDPNRICVALSRAKQGFYCIGNFSLFQRSSPLWRSILKDLAIKKRNGRSLPLQCSRHRTITEVASIADFSKVKDGGCGKKCGARLPCNHVCPRNCHPSEDVHEQPCKEPCPIYCPKRGHRCKLQCFEKCGRCKEPVEQEIPECGHKQNVPCYQSPSDFTCQMKCQKTLPCGHRCRKKCGEECTKECRQYITREWPCGHEAQAECFMTEKMFSNMRKCKFPCGETLECGHVCSGTCGQCHQGRLHKRCQKKCERPLTCGHTCSDKCAYNCPPCKKPCVLACVHGKCDHECFEACKGCPHLCEWKCAHFECTRNCGEMCNRPRCDKPCPITLACNHPCVGLCGEQCPVDPKDNEKPICRICSTERWKELVPVVFGSEEDDDARFIQLVDCGHIFEVEGLDHWMDMEQEGDQIEIKWKTCFTCKTPIRKTHRYGNITKEVIKDMNRVKRSKYYKLTKNQRKKLEGELVALANEQQNLFFRQRGQLSHFERATKTRPDSDLMQDHVILSAAKVAQDNIRELADERSGIANITLLCTQIQEQFIPFLQDNKHKGTNQVQIDVLAERRRIILLASVYKLHSRTTTLFLEAVDKESLTRVLSRCETVGQRIEKLNDEAEYQSLKFQLQAIAKKYLHSPLTVDERKMIIQAIGAKAGSWYKCPKGHFYQISQCGGAMEEGKCPECGARIGGTSHRLLSDNAHAGEFDDSRHSAWSAGAALENYDLHNLQ